MSTATPRPLVYFFILGIFALFLAPQIPTAHAASLVVNTAADTSNDCAVNGTGTCSLRDAITFANSNGEADTITFDIPNETGCTAANVCTITLTGDPTAVSEELVIDGSANTANITLSGNNQFRTMENTAPLTLINLTLTNGYTPYDGGALIARKPLTLTGVTISNSRADWLGGGMHSDDVAYVSNSTISGNTAGAGQIGGAWFSKATVLTNTTISGNTATKVGGAWFDNDAQISGSTISNNTASTSDMGGAYFNTTATITNTTFSGNSATRGGGAYFNGIVTLTNSAFRSNTATYNAADVESGKGGGAFFVSNATLTNVTFDKNDAKRPSVLAGGGAVFSAAANLTGGIFSNNTAAFAGGGAYFNLTATIDGTQFFSNTLSANRGAGAYFNGAAIVQNATFNGNKTIAERGAGAYFNGTADLTATDFITNTSSNRAGGALFNSTATLTNTNFYSNTGTTNGGGAYFGGTLKMTGGIVQGNSCTSCDGGGAYIAAAGTLTGVQFKNNTVSGNGTTTGNGGGILHNTLTLTVINSTFSGNTSTTNNTKGGGIANGNGSTTILNVYNSTFNGNSAKAGGGALATGSSSSKMNILNSTIAGNSSTSASSGGGVASSGATTIKNTLLTANLANNAANNCTGTGITADNSNIADATCNSAVIKTAAQIALGALASNGGSTPTMALGSTSVAIDTGNATTCADTTTINKLDQRGQARDDFQCDIGAFEAKYADTNAVARSGFALNTTYTFGPTLAKAIVTSGDAGTLTITKYTSNPTGKPLNSAFDREWDITSNGTTYNLTLTLCYTDAELGTRDESKLQIYHYTGGAWVALTSTVDAVNNCVSAAGITSLSPFTLSPNAPTAIALNAFHARVHGNRVQVKWDTGSELNLVGFRVYRRAAQGEWRALGADTIPAKHMGEIIGATYKLTDRKVQAQHSYLYKLQVLYADGHTEWTKPVRIQVP